MSTPIDRAESWLKQHERIIIASFTLTLGIWGFNKWVDVSAHNADTAAAVAKTAQATADAQAKAYQDYIAKQTALYEADRAASDAKILTLMQTIASRDAKAATAVQQAQQPKTPTQAVTDLETAYTLPAPVVTTDTGATVPTADLQLFTVTKIQGDTCQADLTDTKEAVTTSQAETESAQKMVTDLQGQVKQDAVTLAAHDKDAAAQIDKVKKDARRSKWHIFWWGYGAGFASREAVKHIFGF